MNYQEITKQQEEVCKKHGVQLSAARPSLKIGVAQNVKSGTMPLNGLRHPQEGDTTGWYIWAGSEFPTEADAFKPVHVEHIEEWAPLVQKYLGLPPGWRFQIDDKGYEDVWEDKSLLVLK